MKKLDFERNMLLPYYVALFCFVFFILSALIAYNYFSVLYGKPQMAKYLVFSDMVLSVFLFLFVKYKVGFDRIGLSKDSFDLKKTIWISPFIVLQLIGFVLILSRADILIQDDLYLFLALLVATLLIGFSEEVAYRGIILNSLLERHGVLFSVFISAVLFSTVHLTNLLAGAAVTDTLVQVLGAFIQGLLYAFLFVQMRKLWPVILLHAIWDFNLLAGPLVDIGILEKLQLVLLLCNYIFLLYFIGKHIIGTYKSYSKTYIDTICIVIFSFVMCYVLVMFFVTIVGVFLSMSELDLFQ